MWTFNADIGYNDTQVLYMYGKILINGEFILVYLAAVEWHLSGRTEKSIIHLA